MCKNSARLSFWLLAGSFVFSSARAQTNFSIYSDQLNNGFQNWSWGANDFNSISPVHSGTKAVLFTGATWEALSFEHSDFNPALYTNLTFWINGDATGGQVVYVYLQNGESNGPTHQLPPLLTNGWQQFNLSLSALRIPGFTNLSRINFQLTSIGKSGAFSVDDVNLAATMPSLVTINVNASNMIRTADARWFGLNTAIWDSFFDTASTSNTLSELGTRILRFPGGSLSDQYHWGTGRTTNGSTWVTTFQNFIHIATNAGVQAMITVNYGTGTPQEAAGWVRHANVTNHLDFIYWEIGNECYGTWEADTNLNPHDPYTYATRAAQYIAQMRAADPTIKLGLPVATGENNYSNYADHAAYNARTGATNYGWTPIVLTTLKSLGVTPDFLVHHVYPQFQGDNDQNLLQASVNWAVDAADLRQQITDYFGTGGTNIELLCTENNNDSATPGRQSTSLVNALYLSDSLAHLMKTEFNGFIWWDLRNGSDTGGDFNSSLYGWRTNGDFGIIGGANTRYPAFYSFKLMQYFARPGDTVLDASSDYSLLSTFATRKTNGALALLVINKDNTANLNARIILTNFFPWPGATMRSYGIAQDEAARTNGAAPAQDIATNSFVSATTDFTTTFPPYSLTLFTFVPEASQLRVLKSSQTEIVLQIQGQAGVPYILQSSSNLVDWLTISTNRLNGTTLNVTNSTALSAPAQFWRVIWAP